MLSSYVIMCCVRCFGVLGVLAMRALKGPTASSGSGGCGRSQWPGLLGLCADCSLEREKDCQQRDWSSHTLTWKVSLLVFSLLSVAIASLQCCNVSVLLSQQNLEVMLYLLITSCLVVMSLCVACGALECLGSWP